MKIAGIIILIIIVAVFGLALYGIYVANPAVIKELQTEPNSARAQKVMLLTLPDGKTLPVNYLREDSLVYAGCDFGWWRTFQGDGADVEILIKGEKLRGRAKAITDNQQYRDDVFSRLRPTAPTWLPEWSKGVLIEIALAEKQ